MTKIAVVDDREDHRHIIATALSNGISNLDLENEWEVIESFPLDTVESYTDWIRHENIGILILDERLTEQQNPQGTSVTYTGGDVVTALRRELKTLPVYGVTAFPENISEQQFGLFDEVIGRTEFSANAEKFVRRFIRLHKDFLDENEVKLTELSDLSAKIATGTADDSEIARAKAIQQDIEIPISSTAVAGRAGWIAKYEDTIKELQTLQSEAAEYLGKDAKETKK